MTPHWLEARKKPIPEVKLNKTHEAAIEEYLALPVDDDRFRPGGWAYDRLAAVRDKLKVDGTLSPRR